MSGIVSLHGKRLQLTPTGLEVDGRLVGTPFVGRGKTFYVHSSVAGTDGRSPRSAVATIDAAINLCTASQGDTIVVLPGHSEAITTAGAITADIAGISIIGLGTGAQRPKVSFGAAAATFVVSAANVLIQNLVFEANFLNVAVGISFAADGMTVRDCLFRNAGASLNFVNPIKTSSATSNACDDTTVEGCRWLCGGDTAGGAFIACTGTNVRWSVMRNMVNNPATATAQLLSVSTGKVLTDTEIGWNMLFNMMTANELFISNDGTTNTGIVHNNYVGHADVTGTHDAGWEAGGWRLFNNLSASVDSLSGFPLPAIDVNL